MGHSNVGADIFVRKIKPGPTVGDGYLVDVYEGGIKIETFRAKNKKQIKSVVKDYKAKYNTSRSFMNESQVHVTYRTKAERGETAMITSLDEQLIKKANYIRSALKKLFTPNDPMIIREADIANNTVDFIPQTPGGNDAITEDSIAKNIIIKVVKFISDRQPQGGAEWVKSDELYNPIKKWLFSVKKSVKDQERANGLQLDFGKVYEIAKNTLLSSDPANIKKLSGIDVSPDVASKIKEIMNMKVGVTKQASAISDISKGEAGTNNAEPSDAKLDKTFDNFLKVTNQDPKSAETDFKAVRKHVDNERAAREEQDNDSLDKRNDGASGNSNPSVELIKGGTPGSDIGIGNVSHLSNDYSNVFWKYASTVKEEATLEDVFLKWASDSKLSLDSANETWKQVNIDLGIFKEATMLALLDRDLLTSVLNQSKFMEELGKIIKYLVESEPDFNKRDLYLRSFMDKNKEHLKKSLAKAAIVKALQFKQKGTDYSYSKQELEDSYNDIDDVMAVVNYIVGNIENFIVNGNPAQNYNHAIDKSRETVFKPKLMEIWNEAITEAIKLLDIEIEKGSASEKDIPQVTPQATEAVH